jgi:hypothetical protein
MAVEVSTDQQAVVITWDKNKAQGNKATIFAKNPEEGAPKIVGGDLEEKKTVENTGTNALAFPLDYEGECYVEVSGSDRGTDTGTIYVGATAAHPIAPPGGAEVGKPEFPTQLPDEGGEAQPKS